MAQEKLGVQGPFVLIASAAYTGDQNSPTVHAGTYRGIHLVVDATADPGTASVVFTLQGKDHAGNWYDVLALAAIASVTEVQATVFPGAPVTANLSANAFLPAEFRIEANHADEVESLTYSVGYTLLP